MCSEEAMNMLRLLKIDAEQAFWILRAYCVRMASSGHVHSVEFSGMLPGIAYA